MFSSRFGPVVSATLLLSLFASYPSFAEPACTSMVGDNYYYLKADLAQVPVALSEQISFERTLELNRSGGTYYWVHRCRGSMLTLDLTKYVDGKPVMGFEYEFENGRVVGLRYTFIDGQRTVWSKMQGIN